MATAIVGPILGAKLLGGAGAALAAAVHRVVR
jgi:hypothetical protein